MGKESNKSDTGLYDTDEKGKFTQHSIKMIIMATHRFVRDRAGCIYEWDQELGYWALRSENRVRALAYQYEREETHSTNARRTEIAGLVLDHPTVQTDEIQWNQLKSTEIPLKDCIYNIATGETRTATPEDWLDYSLPHEFSPGAECPTWLRCLEEWFSDIEEDKRKEVILSLQEFFGYCILPHAKYKKALFLRGEGDTGKSVVEHALRMLVGKGNYCTITPDEMGDPRAIAPIKGKMVNLISELSTDAMVDDGGFKRLVSSEDSVQINPKYQAQFSYTPICKHIICSNNLPYINDASRATYNRLLIIPMNNVIERSAQDPFLPQKLEREICGILNWAIAGAKRLTANRGLFTVSEISTKEVADFAYENNPVAQFVDDMCERGPNAKIAVSTFVERFNAWHEGRDWTKKAISTRMKGLGFKLERMTNVRYYSGIRLRDSADRQTEQENLSLWD